jgi:hypothetical protein
MAYTQADIDALDLEIAKVRTVKASAHGDQSATFRDLDEMLKLRALMAQAVAASSGGTRTRLAATSKGI